MIDIKNADNKNRVVTFGCRLNTYESEVIKKLSAEAGLEGAIIINSCAVTAEAERQVRQSIRKLRRENPNAEIIVTGCSAQIDPDKYANMPEINSVIGNAEKLQLSTYASIKDQSMTLVNDIMSVRETAGHLVSGFEGKARAFVQVQNGCDHRCTFCTIPFGRGNSRSVPLGEVVAQIRQVIESGYQEIVLTGVDITAYGADLPGAPPLGQAIKRILALVPDLKRLRLSSLDPVEIDDDLWKLIESEPRLLSHLHISLQAGDNMILKRMKRRHLREDAIAFCKRARDVRPDIVFGVDLIAGFPTETPEMFDNTLRIIDDCDLTFLHVFPYSPRPGTPASRMPQVAGPIIKERAAILRHAGEKAVQRLFDRLLGETVAVLVESVKDGIADGKTDHFASIRFPVDLHEIEIGSVHTVKVLGKSGHHLEGAFC
ncbi:MAG: tRNA (N(6)-L-threonylcarbamoyladenosine(37)-C(2))-methylthiotransferase MtaB [Alphaproteobacteria bacterium]|nr:tRNA (N(6)-L-threonylcarbamoyladenosine(37)-C(2))-methylthiotransferase MtaB [Alphaproteobacteria bacterium]